MRRLVHNAKAGEIELFRFVFCVLIMLRHSEYLLGDWFPVPGGSFGVEFFFIVSGYLMMATVQKKADQPIRSLGAETGQFVWKKLSAIYLDIIIAFVIGLVFQCCAKQYTFAEVIDLLGDSVFELLMIERLGIGQIRINSVIWYVQSMLLCMAILYPLLRKYMQLMKRLVFPLASLLILGWLCQTYGNLRTPSLWVGFTYKGNLRAMAELCIGVICFPIAQPLRQMEFSNGFRIVLAALKWLCWGAVLAYMFVGSVHYDFLCCMLFALAIILAFSGQCADCGLYQNKFVMWLGKVSLPLYLNHIYFSRYLGYIVPAEWSVATKLALYVICAASTATLATWIAKGLRRLWPNLRNTLSKQICSR